MMVIAKEGFRDEEYIEPRKVLERYGAEIRVASLERGEAVGVKGKRVDVDLTVDQVDPQEFAAVIFVGGEGVVSLVDNPSLIGLARDFHNAGGKIIAAICAAPAILANAGLLKGKVAVCTPNVGKILAAGGTLYGNTDVAIAENIITAKGPLASTQFGEAIAHAIK